MGDIQNTGPPEVSPHRDAVHPDAVDPDAAEPYELTRPTGCRACGYDLRGLMSDARCPECGTPVAAALEEGLAFAPPAYVRRLAWGAALSTTGVMFPTVVIGLIGASAARLALWPIVMSLIWFSGLWLLTTPDPALAPAGERRTARGLLRATCLPLFALLLVWGFVGSPVVRAALLAAAGVETALSAAVLVQVVLEFRYLRILAMRCGNVLLAWRTRTVMWGVTLSLAVRAGVMSVSGFRSAASPFAGLGWFGFIVPVGVLVFFSSWWMVLMGRYKECLNRIRRDAAVNWAAHLARVDDGGDGGAGRTPSDRG
ncbi:MAG: hypothetical protein ACOC95_02020 [Planctomycetota bacterium]